MEVVRLPFLGAEITSETGRECVAEKLTEEPTTMPKGKTSFGGFFVSLPRKKSVFTSTGLFHFATASSFVEDGTLQLRYCTREGLEILSFRFLLDQILAYQIGCPRDLFGSRPDSL